MRRRRRRSSHLMWFMMLNLEGARKIHRTTKVVGHCDDSCKILPLVIAIDPTRELGGWWLSLFLVGSAIFSPPSRQNLTLSLQPVLMTRAPMNEASATA